MMIALDGRQDRGEVGVGAVDGCPGDTVGGGGDPVRPRRGARPVARRRGGGWCGGKRDRAGVAAE